MNAVPNWLKTPAIENALKRKDPPETSVIQDIIAKSLALNPLGLDEIVALLRVQSPEDRKIVREGANAVKQKVYGDRIVLTAPLHVDNHCASNCLYCAYRSVDDRIERKRLEPGEIREAGKKLIRQGHKRIVLVSGQTESMDMDYIVKAVETLFGLFEGSAEVRRVNLDLGALTREQCEILRGAAPGTLNIYQETYHEASYRLAHPTGPKSDYLGRVNGPDIALDSGIEDVGLGLAFGLGPHDFDILALSEHTAHLARDFGTGSRTINLHRVRPAPGTQWEPPYALNDDEFLHAVAVVRLAIPYAGILLTTREPAGIWREGCDAGGSQLLTGSMANPYESWTDAPGEKAPFPIGEETHLDEVVRFLLERARHLPSFCTACPRLGRSGSEFISLVSQGDIRSQCGPNSLASFLEFLLNYSTPYTRQLGEKLISEKLEAMPEHERGAAEKLLQKVRMGRLDEFI